MLDALKMFGKAFAVMMAVGMLAVSGAVVYFSGPGTIKPEPKSDVAAKLSTGWHVYGQELSASAAAAEAFCAAEEEEKAKLGDKYKPKLVQDLLDAIAKRGDASRDKFRDVLNEFMMPVLGPRVDKDGKEIDGSGVYVDDPTAAKLLFGEMKRGWPQ